MNFKIKLLACHLDEAMVLGLGHLLGLLRFNVINGLVHVHPCRVKSDVGVDAASAG